MKTLILGVILFASLVHAKFDYAKEVAGLQLQLDQLHTDGKLNFPVVILDRDELFYRAFKEKAIYSNQTAEKKRLDILQNYVKSKIGFSLDKNQLVNLDVYTYLIRESAAALQLKKDFFASGGIVMCAVFPMLPNSNQILENSRMLQIPTEQVYADKTVYDYKHKMDYEKMALFSLYHEVGHCLDNKYMSKFADDQSDSHMLHLAESFSEVFAMLALRKAGVTDLGEKRGILRTVYSRKLGRHMGQRPQNGFGNPNYVNAGAIYNLRPVILAADDYIKTNGSDIENKSWPELIERAHEIVDAEGTEFRSFGAISSFLKTKEPTEVLSRYKRWASDYPELFTTAEQDLRDYIADTNLVLKDIFKKAPSRSRVNDLQQIDYAELCELESQSKQSFFDKLFTYRDELEKSDAELIDMKSRATELSHVFDKMQTSCSEVTVAY